MKIVLKLLKLNQKPYNIRLSSTFLNTNYILLVYFVYLCSCECLSLAKVIYVNTLFDFNVKNTIKW